MINYREVIDHYCQFLKERSSYHLELHFMQKKSPITFIYDKNQYDLYCITADVLKDLFPDKERNLLKSDDAFLGSKMTSILLWMGYSSIEDVVSHLDELDQYFYTLKITLQPHALKNRYQDYLNSHIICHEIPYSLYCHLKESQQDLHQAWKQYYQYIDDIVEKLSAKVYFIENEEVEDEYSALYYEYIQAKDLLNVLDSLEELCVVRTVMEKFNQRWFGYHIICDLQDYIKQVDNYLHNSSYKEAEESINLVLQHAFLSKDDRQILKQYIQQKKKAG